MGFVFAGPIHPPAVANTVRGHMLAKRGRGRHPRQYRGSVRANDDQLCRMISSSESRGALIAPTMYGTRMPVEESSTASRLAQYPGEDKRRYRIGELP